MMSRQILLLCGALSPLMYAFADALAGMRWDGYSFRDQTISELGAIGAPSQALFSSFLIPTYLLLVAFGVGVRQSARGRPKVRMVGGLLVGLGVLALTFIYLMPAFGALLAFVFLGEGLQMYQLAGGAAIFAGIAILNWKRSAQ